MAMLDIEWCPRCQENVRIDAEIEKIIEGGEEKKLLKRYCSKCGTYFSSSEVLEIEEK